MEYEDYKDLEDGLSNLPVTWYPALIQKMVKVAYDKRVFKKGGASIFIARSVENAVLTSDIHSDGESDAVYCAGCGFTHKPGKCPDGLNSRR